MNIKVRARVYAVIGRYRSVVAQEIGMVGILLVEVEDI